MPLEVETVELDSTYMNRAQILPNGKIIYPSDEEITTGDLLALVNNHRSRLESKYWKRYKYYVGRHPILHKKKKPAYKPDNRLIINFPRKAVTSFNGFFIGTPVKIDSEDKKTDQWIAQWMNKVNLEDVNSEVSKMSSMYGHAYYFLYQSDRLDDKKQVQTMVTKLDPLHTFLIYDDSFDERVIYGVRYRRDSKNSLLITLYDENYERHFELSTNGLVESGKTIANPFPGVPIVEAVENEERMALCEDVFSLVDAQNEAMSSKANDVDYFGDAYLKFINTYLQPDQTKDIKENRIINVNGENAGNATVEFMSKPDGDVTQEHLIDRVADYMYQIANVTNLNDQAFAGDISGVALQMKFQAMADMARTKTLKFTKALREVMRLSMAVNSEVKNSNYADLTFKFTQSIPKNVSEEADLVTKLWGKVSTETLYKQLSFIDDPEAELKKFKAEQAENAALGGQMMQKAMAGEDDDHRGAKGSAADQAGQPAQPTN